MREALFKTRGIYRLYIDGTLAKTYQRAVKKGFALVDQNFRGNSYIKHLSLSENLSFQVFMNRRKFPIIRKRVTDHIGEQSLRYFDKEELENHGLSFELKTLFLRLLYAKPKAIIIQNALVYLDPLQSEGVSRLIDEIAYSGTGILLITPDIITCLSLCDKVMYLDRSKKIHEIKTADTSPDELYSMILAT